MKRRRVGCLSFGLLWALVFGMTWFGQMMGDRDPIDCTGIAHCDPYPKRWSDYMLWIEVGALIVAAALYYRAEMNGDD